jgi:hypothetical protein
MFQFVEVRFQDVGSDLKGLRESGRVRQGSPNVNSSKGSCCFVEIMKIHWYVHRDRSILVAMLDALSKGVSWNWLIGQHASGVPWNFWRDANKSEQDV